MQLSDFTIHNLFDLSETIAADLFDGRTYPWEVLGDIQDYIIALGNKLPADRFEKREGNIWVAKSAKMFDSAYIGGPCIIDEEAEVRQCAFIRGSAIVGKGATVGNSTELKNVVLFNKVEVPHYNYVGDSVLGFHAHMGAGSITSNIKADRKNIVIHAGRLGGYRLQQRPQSRHRDRTAHKRLPALHGQRLRPFLPYLQG